MTQVSHESYRAASLRLARVVSHLRRAGQQLSTASIAGLDHYHREEMHRLAVDLRSLSLPIELIAASLDRGCRR